MVSVAREVGLARHADLLGVGNVAGLVSGTAIVTVRFVVARSDHVRLDRRDGRHLIVEVVQDALVHLVAIRNGRVGKEAANLLLQPGVRVSNITSWRGLA